MFFVSYFCFLRVTVFFIISCIHIRRFVVRHSPVPARSTVGGMPDTSRSRQRYPPPTSQTSYACAGCNAAAGCALIR